MSKRKIRGNYTPVRHAIQDCDAWLAMSMGARLLYIAARRYAFNDGSNNGHARFSNRQAQKALGSGDEEVTIWFREVQHYGFMVLASKGYLGGEGRGFASASRFTELPTPDGGKPTDDYMLWDGELFVRPQKKTASPKIKTPSRKTGTPRPGKPGHSRPGIPGHSGQKARKTPSRNSGTSLENACHAVGSVSVERGRAEGCEGSAQTATTAAAPKRTGPLPGRRAAPYREDSAATSKVPAEAVRPQQRSRVNPKVPECDPPVAAITSPAIDEAADLRKRVEVVVKRRKRMGAEP